MGVAESFLPGKPRSILGGVVMRGDGVIDGAGIGKTTVGGDDATNSIASLVKRQLRNDINAVLVSGCVLSLYNIVDPEALSSKTKLPVVCLTYKETSGIEGSIRRRFPETAEAKLAAYRRLGERDRVPLASGGSVFVRASGISLTDTKKLLDIFTTQGAIPEPIKVARLFARAVSAKL